MTDDEAMERAKAALAWLYPDGYPFAIREAMAFERERCARVAEERAEFNRGCPAGCKCADGWHIAMKIREGAK